MTSAPTFTAGSVTALMPADGGGRATYFDRGQGAVRGLCVRVTGACHRSFWFRYEHDGAKRWIPLGDVGETSLKGARAAADALRARVGRARRGETSFPHEDDRNPRRADVEDAGALTFGKVAEAWLASDRFGALRAATRREYGRVVRKLLVPAFGSSAPNGIVRQDVADFLLDLRDGFDVREDTKPKDRRSPRFSRWDTKDREPAGVMANRVRAILGSLYAWATAEDQRKVYGVTENPFLGLERIFDEPEPTPRPYSPDEVRRIFTASAGVDELAHLVPLIAYTLTRSNEARGADWREFDFETKRWKIPAERSKDRREHIVPLSDGAVRELTALRIEQGITNPRAAGFVFPADTKAGHMDQPQDSIGAVRRTSDVADFRLHDLRDTAAHWMREELRVRGQVIEDLLSHTPTRLERTYQGERRSSLAEMAEALDLWSDTLDKWLGIARKRARKRSAKAKA